MDLKARAFGQPLVDKGRLVGPVVAHNEVHVLASRGVGVYGVEELPDLLEEEGPVESLKVSVRWG
jgi:hypothetical protein